MRVFVLMLDLIDSNTTVGVFSTMEKAINVGIREAFCVDEDAPIKDYMREQTSIEEIEVDGDVIATYDGHGTKISN